MLRYVNATQNRSNKASPATCRFSSFRKKRPFTGLKIRGGRTVLLARNKRVCANLLALFNTGQPVCSALCSLALEPRQVCRLAGSHPSIKKDPLRVLKSGFTGQFQNLFNRKSCIALLILRLYISWVMAYPPYNYRHDNIIYSLGCYLYSKISI